MRQLRLIPSGCRVQSHRVLDSSKDRFGYCTTMAIYIYDLRSLTLEKLIAVPGRSVTNFTWCPSESNLVASSSGDGSVMVWNINEESMMMKCSLPSGVYPGPIAWCPQDNQKMAVLSTNGDIYLWNTNPVATQKLQVVHRGDATTMRWSDKGASMLLALGTRHGRIMIMNVSDRNRLVSMPTIVDIKDSISVIDIRWDPNSCIYLLVLYSNGKIVMFDTESCTLAMEFDSQKSAVALSWNRLVAGEFFTISSAKPTLDIWNVSQKSPISRCKLGDKSCAALTMEMSAESASLLISFVDGSIILLDVKSKMALFTSQPGHWETIFDCKFKPSDANILATASFDGTIKIWDMSEGKFKMEMNGGHGCVYALSWEPGSSSNIVSGSVDGNIDLWDTTSGKRLRSFDHHAQSCYRLCWNPVNASQIVSTSSDTTAVIFNPNGEISATLCHPEPVYGCDFNVFNDNLLATGCHDGIVRIYDLHFSTEKPIHELKGHGQRVFNTVWSPLLPNTLASGSDDKTIRVWNIADRSSTVFEGHHDRVRALIWNHEIPFLLISGSWDSTMRVWDVRNTSCITVVQDHQADIYGLASHPLRPFTLASSSRDTSIRLWELDEDIITRLHIICSIDTKLGISRLRDKPEAAMNINNPRILCGPGSQQLSQQQQSSLTPSSSSSASLLLNASRVSRFFTSAPGIDNLWILAASVSNDVISPLEAPILHMSQMSAAALCQSKAIQSTISGATGRGKRREIMLQAADILILNGKFREYCQTLIEVEEWEKAIAVAPSVSIEYWRDITRQYADYLGKDSKHAATPFWIATGAISSAVQFYEDIGDLDTAMMVAVSGQESNTITVGKPPSPPQISPTTGNNPGGIPNNGSSKSSTLVDEVIDRRSQRAFDSSNAIIAACHHLSGSRIRSAIQLLVRGGEFITAFALQQSLDNYNVSDTASIILRIAERLQMWDEVKRLWDLCHWTVEQRASMCNRYRGDKDLLEFYKEMGLNNLDHITRDMIPNSNQMSPAQKIRLMVYAKKYSDAIIHGCENMKNMMSNQDWSIEAVWEIITILHDIDAVQVNERDRVNLLCYCSYVGGLIAGRKGYRRIAMVALSNCRKLISDNALIEFPVDPIVIMMQQINYCGNYKQFSGLAQTIARVEGSSRHVTEIIHGQILQMMNQTDIDSKDLGVCCPDPIRISCSKIPSARHSKFPAISMFSGQPIYGAPFPLPDGGGCIDRAEAIMWASVNPFSPTNSGLRLHPF